MQHGSNGTLAWHTNVHGGVGSMWQLQAGISWLQLSVQGIAADQHIGLRETGKVVCRVVQPHLQGVRHWHSGYEREAKALGLASHTCRQQRSGCAGWGCAGVLKEGGRTEASAGQQEVSPAGVRSNCCRLKAGRLLVHWLPAREEPL